MFARNNRHLRASRRRLGNDHCPVIRGPMPPLLAVRQNLNPHRPADPEVRIEVVCFVNLANQTRRSSPKGHIQPSDHGGCDGAF